MNNWQGWKRKTVKFRPDSGGSSKQVAGLFVASFFRLCTGAVELLVFFLSGVSLILGQNEIQKDFLVTRKPSSANPAPLELYQPKIFKILKQKKEWLTIASKAWVRHTSSHRVNLEPISGNLGHKAGGTLDWVTTHHRLQSHTHTAIYTLQTRDSNQPTMCVLWLGEGPGIPWRNPSNEEGGREPSSSEMWGHPPDQADSCWPNQFLKERCMLKICIPEHHQGPLIKILDISQFILHQRQVFLQRLKTSVLYPYRV